MRRQRWMMRHFLAGAFLTWALWSGLGLVVAELRQRSTAAHAEGVLRRIPFWVNYEASEH